MLLITWEDVNGTIRTAECEDNLDTHPRKEELIARYEAKNNVKVVALTRV
jgi:hypothetical protein